jgi:hypothetical protein
MLSRLSRRLSYANVMATLGVFIALGGSAYAVNTVNSSDIVDGQVKSVDVGDAEILSADVKDQSLTTFDVSTFLGADVVDGTLTGADIGDDSLTSADVQNFSLGNGDFLTGSVDSRVVTNNSLTGTDAADNSLTGADINESTLNLPQTPTTATFVAVPDGSVRDGFTSVASKSVPGGAYAVTATANLTSLSPYGGTDLDRDTVCELRNGTAFIGGATDRRRTHSGDHTGMSLSMNGGAQVPAGGGDISLWCRVQGPGVNGITGSIDYGQMMIIRLDGFF